MNLEMAGLMHKPQIREVIFTPAFLRHHMMNVEYLAIFQVLMTDRANILLPLDELTATMRCHLRLGSSLLPIVL